MFKFRSSLVNQLLNHVKINPEWNFVEQDNEGHEVISTSDKRPLTSSRRQSTVLANVKRKQVQSVLLRLKKANLEVLLNAVQTGIPGDCVFVPACGSTSSSNAGSSSSSPPPHILLSQVFRWPDLQFEWELKRLDFYCRPHHFDQQQKETSNFCQPKLYECCNPYHWTRTLPNPTTFNYNAQSEVDLDRQLGEEDRRRCAENRVGNQLPSSESEPSASTISRPPYPKRPKRRTSTSSTTNQSGSPLLQPQWCQLAYWEECNRVGRLVPVSSSHIEVFSLLPKSKGRHEGSGLCLATLFKQNKSPSESTAKTREKIGQGILLSQVENGVWVYNRTSNPIFVNSPTLEPSPNLSAPSSTNDQQNQDNFTVIRVSPGYSIQVFDYQKSDFYERIRQPLGMPFDPYSIRISFAKGWGTKYSRQVVTNCPCWLEILLTVHR